MIRKVATLLLLLCALCGTQRADAQIYTKLNGVYACVGVINPQVEFRLSKHSAFQAEFVYSPWESINGHPFVFGIFMNEYRYFIKESNSGFYFGANGGMMTFRMSKPYFSDGAIHFQNRYCKGYGYMFGISAGYEYKFAKRWILDVFFGFSFMESWYNGYSMDGQIDMDPHRPAWKQPPYPDPFNGSAEWLPNKFGLSIGFLIFDPDKQKRG